MATVVFLTACVGLSADSVLVEIPRGWWFVYRVVRMRFLPRFWTTFLLRNILLYIWGGGIIAVLN